MLTKVLVLTAIAVLVVNADQRGSDTDTFDFIVCGTERENLEIIVLLF